MSKVPTNKTSHARRILIGYRKLQKTAALNVKNHDTKILMNAFRFANRAHHNQKRLSGEPYIIHPLAVANTLASFGMDNEAVVAGLLHDVVEDTQFGTESIKKRFGEDVNKLVLAVTKISTVKKQSRTVVDPEHYSTLKRQEAAENIRLMLLATARDIRVIIIKLADKLHNMQTLKYQKAEKVERIAEETLSIYAPIAGRLGIFQIKSELEDLAFAALHPKEFEIIEAELQGTKQERKIFINKIKEIMVQRLASIQIIPNIEGRNKHIYSIYQKMSKQGKEIENIYDLRGIRILVDEIKDCYGALGIVHTLWPPIQGRFKDYIAMPKSNGYQSLNTTVMGPDGRPLEIQIRTNAMNQVAEYGVAAHWIYKTKQSGDSHPHELGWLKRLTEFSSELQKNSDEFIEQLRTEIHPDEVYVFTPKGDVIDLPLGSCILDLAFHIHTEIGLSARGARVNDRIVPLRYQLKSGDRVEILTGKHPQPSPNWLRYLHSRHARQKLRSWFRQLEEIEEKKSEKINIPEGLGTQDSQKLAKLGKLKIRRKKSKNPKRVPIEIAGVSDIPVRYAGCCTPVPGDRIIGFITRGRGVTIHRVDCPVLPDGDENENRTIEVVWEGLTEKYPVHITIEAFDRQGLYLDLVGAISKTSTNILKADANIPNNMNDSTITAKFTIEVEHVDHLQEIFDSLYSINGVVNVIREDKKLLKLK